jgi:hypothetical protein
VRLASEVVAMSADGRGSATNVSYDAVRAITVFSLVLITKFPHLGRA